MFLLRGGIGKNGTEVQNLFFLPLLFMLLLQLVESPVWLIAIVK